MYVRIMYVHVFAFVFVYVCNTYMCMYVCRLYMYVCICIYVSMYQCMYVFTYACAYIFYLCETIMKYTFRPIAPIICANACPLHQLYMQMHAHCTDCMRMLHLLTPGLFSMMHFIYSGLFSMMHFIYLFYKGLFCCGIHFLRFSQRSALLCLLTMLVVVHAHDHGDVHAHDYLLLMFAFDIRHVPLTVMYH